MGSAAALTAVTAAAALAVALPGAAGDPALNEWSYDPTAGGVPQLRELALLEVVDPEEERVRWRRSRAIGLPHDGRLERGVQLPPRGDTFFTWDPVHDRRPNRAWRRWGTDRLVRTTLRVADRYFRGHPDAPRLAIGDLSRPRGGSFGAQYGGLGHRSHQNGLDIDIYYPRRDRRELGPRRPEQVDLRLSQALVDMFVAAGAERVFVGPSLDLRGPKRIVSPLVHHDDHMHVRLPNVKRRRRV